MAGLPTASPFFIDVPRLPKLEVMTTSMPVVVDTLEQLASREATLAAELEEATRKAKAARRAIAAMQNHLGPKLGGPTTYDLPVEILTQIFLLVHESQTLTRNSVSSPFGSEVPLDWNPEVMVTLPVRCSTWPRAEVTLSQVCRHWRDITLGLPSLWSVFWTRPETVTCEGLVTETQRLQAYLLRSKDRHLELYFEFQPPASLPSDADTTFWCLMKGMLFAALECAHRWKCFTLSAVNHDKRMSERLVVPLQESLAAVVAPSLQKFVVRTSLSGVGTESQTTGGPTGWEEQVIRGPDSQHRPPLKYVKLDRAALPFFRPHVGSAVHIVLEYGVRNGAASQPTFQLDWAAFISDILRSPHLESLSICEDLLRVITFPSSAWDWAGLHVNMPNIKHLRLGRCQDRSERHSALYFLLRYITAPHLESLTVAGYTMEECPWGLSDEEEWLTQWEGISGFRAVDVFPSLKSLYLIDLTVPPKAVARVAGAFIRLADITTSAQSLVVSASLKPLFEESFLEYESLPVEEFWPQAQEVTLNYEIGYRFYQWSRPRIPSFVTPWESLRVLYLPPTQIALWSDTIDCGMGNFRRWGQDIVFAGDEYCTGFFVVKPIGELVPKYWPPDADFTPRNTLEFEGATPPFYQSVVKVDW